MARCARRSLRMAQCCRLGAAKRRASAGPGAKVLARSMAIAHSASKTGGNQNGERPDFYRDRIANVVRRRQQSDLNLYFLDGLTLIDDPLFLLVTNNVP